jgi:hypothetical protein
MFDVPKKRKRRTKEELKEHYVNGDEMIEEIRHFYKTGEFTNNLADMLQKIANGLARRSNFSNYSYKDFMVGDAIVKMITALKNKNFKLNSGYNPFSYFNRIAFRAFLGRIKLEKKRHEGLLSYQSHVYDSLKEEGLLPAVKNEKTYNLHDE